MNWNTYSNSFSYTFDSYGSILLKREEEKVCINIKNLYETYGKNLNYCEIKYVPKGMENNPCDYYELYFDDKLVCMDKEICVVKKRYNFSNMVELSNPQNSHEQSFALSREEFKCATESQLITGKIDDYSFEWV